MNLSRIFSNLSKDLSLIKMTKDNRYGSQIIDGLHEMGWRKEERVKFVSNAYLHGTFSYSYNSKVFVSENGYQGDKNWYKDLAELAMPGHKPGLLTYFLGAY